MKTVVIAQARMGSARLPGKVLKPLGARPVLAHVLARAHKADGVDQVCLATSTLAADDPVAEAAQALGFPVFRGSESDVLGRYAGAAEMTKAERVVRITCDCPLIDPSVIASAVRGLKEKNADYVCNVLKPDWPHGLDCEAFPRAWLERAAAGTQDAYDREHVTPWIRRNAARSLHLPGPGGIAAEQRWVLDYPEGCEYLTRIFPPCFRETNRRCNGKKSGALLASIMRLVRSMRICGASQRQLKVPFSELGYERN